MFKILWALQKKRCGFHLGKWEKNLQPKGCGGWGFKKLHRLGLYLAMKILWTLLTGSRIWNNVVADKYLKNQSIVDWFWSGHGDFTK